MFMVGGNIAGKTRVMTTSIVLETQQGNMNYIMVSVILSSWFVALWLQSSLVRWIF